MDTSSEITEITFLKNYRVKSTKCIDKEKSIFCQLFENKSNEEFIVEMKDNQYYGTGLLKSNGIIRMNFKFEPKKSEHRVSVFDEQGQIIFDGFERNNLKTGECVDYVNGNIVFIGTYQNGMRNGYGTSFDENGNVLNAGRWKNNI